MGRKRVPGSVNNLYPFFHSSLSFHPFFFFFQVALITHLILQYILMCLLTTSPTRMQKVKSSLAYFPGDSVGRDSAHNAGDCLQYRRFRLDPWARKTPHVGGQLSLCAATPEPHIPESWRTATRETTAMRGPCITTWESLHAAAKTPYSPKFLNN